MSIWYPLSTTGLGDGDCGNCGVGSHDVDGCSTGNVKERQCWQHTAVCMGEIMATSTENSPTVEEHSCGRECKHSVFGSAFHSDDETATAMDQRACEAAASALYRDCMARIAAGDRDTETRLYREAHTRYLRRAIQSSARGGKLSSSMISLDASRSWLCYWSTHGLALLGEEHDETTSAGIVALLSSFQRHDTGGFSGGGCWQTPHVASTYASVATLVSIGSIEALTIIDRPKMLEFLLSLKVPLSKGGGFRLMHDGEVDVRGAYCALATAYMLDLPMEELTVGIEAHISACQTYEGGIGGAPGCEAHGGYTFCGLAAYVLCKMVANDDESVLNTSNDCNETLNLFNLLKWASSLQGGIEGGFAGRTNKLVDGCYSFWVGSTLTILKNLMPYALKTCGLLKDVKGDGREIWEAIKEKMNLYWCQSSNSNCSTSNGQSIESVNAYGVHEMLKELFTMNSSKTNMSISDSLYDVLALQAWILICCQDENGGLRDKPGKVVDFYHTCYCLSGLSLAQHCRSDEDGPPIILGNQENLLEKTDALINVTATKLSAARHFYTLLSDKRPNQ